MKFSILGSSGFIGSHLVRHLRGNGVEVFSPARGEPISKERNLGHVIYCIGLNGSLSAAKPLEMAEAHVSHLINILKNFRYESFLYLSSARVYAGAKSTEEEAALPVNPVIKSDFYAISKLMGEAVCFAVNNPSVRVVRLSNVYGNDFKSSNFLPVIIQEALAKKYLLLQSSLLSAKDYVSVRDVVETLPRLAQSGRHRIYNVASGTNVTHQRLISRLQEITDCRVEVQSAPPVIVYPPINIQRIKQEFDFYPKSVLADLENLVAQFQGNPAQPASILP